MHVRPSYPVVRKILVIGAILLHGACSDTFEASYVSLADAERAGAMERGWLPSFLPLESRDIREIHNLDTNQVWFTFRFVPAAANAFRNSLIAIPADGRLLTVRPTRAPWWPAALQGTINAADVKRDGYDLYSHGSILFAVDWQSGTAYCYKPSS